MNIVFDLDGTLIDSSERMYRLFQKLVPESTLSKDEYWELKRNKINHKVILEKYFPDEDFEAFNKKWLSQIERPEYLEMDENYADTIEVLTELENTYALILLTARQSEEQLKRELQRLGLKGYFKEILITANKCSKEDLIKDIQQGSDDWFISDMGRDIVLGKMYGYHTAGITHGFMNEERLQEYRPEIIVRSLSEFAENLK